MSAPSLDVLAIQLRQIVSQIDQISAQTWNVAGMPTDGAATITTRLDDARHAVWMAAVRAEVELKQQSKPLPVCANDGKRDPKPNSGDDPRWRGPEYDKYEADERRGA